jgi:predicted small secreted protein
MTIRNAFNLIAIGTLALAAAACNTVSGAGEDLQSASEDVKEEI